MSNGNKTTREIRAFLNAVSENNGCSECGYYHSPASIDFHHIDPGLKEFSIAKASRKAGWRRTVEELKKTSPLCSNCHNEFEAGAIRIDFFGKECKFIEETLNSNPEWIASYKRSVKRYDRISMQ
jgi:formate-dependent nitrite reductase cytochrome c552 subunit